MPWFKGKPGVGKEQERRLLYHVKMIRELTQALRNIDLALGDESLRPNIETLLENVAFNANLLYHEVRNLPLN